VDNRAPSAFLRLVLVRRVLRRRLADALEDPRVRLLAGVPDLLDLDLDPPLVAVVEQVRDPLTLFEAEVGDRRLRALGAALLELERRRVLGLGAVPELPAQPERVEVRVVPAEPFAQQLVQIRERVSSASATILTTRGWSTSSARKTYARPTARAYFGSRLCWADALA
jgi:hypothetical protein